MALRPITDAEVYAYRQIGVAKLPGYVDRVTVDTLLEALDDRLRHRGPWYSECVYTQDRCFALLLRPESNA